MTERDTKDVELGTLLESLPEAVFIVDQRGCILEANTPTEVLIKIPHDQLRGMRLAEAVKVVSIRSQDKSQGRSAEAANGAIERALKGERIRNERRTFELSDEQRVNVLISANPMRGPDGKIVGALVVVADVTELNHLQQRAADTERQSAIGHMAASLVHDFNNVLDTLEKAVTLLEIRENSPAEQRRNYLDIMHKAVRRGAEIVGRLKQFTRNSSGEVSTLALKQVVEESLELVVPMLQTTNTNVKLHRELADVGSVRANASDLRRVFTNLLINALQAMPQGGDLTVRMERAGEVTARVMVGDTGVGIAPQDRKKVFYPYFTTKSSGTGLGLSGAQRIIVSYRGRIDFQSEPGNGTRFTVELPLAPANGGQKTKGEAGIRAA